jgi:hypothetical protein
LASKEIQFVSNEAGEPTAVIVPIDLWREIESERETACLLSSEAMKRRLLDAKQLDQGIPFEAVIEKLGVDASAFEDLAWVDRTRPFTGVADRAV